VVDVDANPGDAAFTGMPCSANSRARARVGPETLAFVQDATASDGSTTSARSATMFTLRLTNAK